ncbi:hypothetical protein EF910_32180 [Streptomyces sp. WAC07149]|uniref:hypothetical protein n=1 Tax=Streptomyces sp. WAC07149 TaxID=2487425 RepID=UPI000F776896|nr:hypothetical protein [Streptomyces sp. WAC07149]RST00395.1 hypothetical protein EF910_32180 [Streptomyces sp. WAC07149]
MGLLRWNGVFDAVDEQFGELAPDGSRDLSIATSEGGLTLRVEEARAAALAVGDASLRRSVWAEVVRRARGEASTGEPWSLFGVWLGLPVLRGLSFRVGRYARGERKDVEAELLLGFIEAVRDADPDAPDVGHAMLVAAGRRAWAFAKSDDRETVTEDVELVSVCRGGPQGDPLAVDGWEIHLPTPAGQGGLTAPLRLTAGSRTAEGERLGMVAEELGLADVLDRARCRTRGRTRVATVSLRRVRRGL